DPQKARLVELRYFAGLTGDQVPRSWGSPPAASTGSGPTRAPGSAASWASPPSPTPELRAAAGNPDAGRAGSRIAGGGRDGPTPGCLMTEEEIFHQARAHRDPQERAAYLEQACGGDAALR